MFILFFIFFILLYLYVYFLWYNHLLRTLYYDLMNYLLYICMPICCMTLVNKDNNNKKNISL
jgi:hypothetical protein